ncbi:hypothetical protein AB4Z50_17105 [Paenibacillus sp. 2TAB26]|uniref:hypothetical protein n=1 Tax=Paenibacillus sp. 2TAB26 TaxID=3233005 RepID=UPI003F9666D7
MITGYKEGAFHSNDPITRAEIALMLARASGKSIEGKAITGFTEDKYLPAWATCIILYMRQLHLV